MSLFFFVFLDLSDENSVFSITNQPYAVSMGTMGGSSEAPLIHHHHYHHFEALLIAIELNGVSRGYAQAYAQAYVHKPGLHKLHKGYSILFDTIFVHSTQ